MGPPALSKDTQTCKPLPSPRCSKTSTRSRREDEARLPLLETRQQTHGSFESNAMISQSLKSMLRASQGWQRLTDVECEVMDMICLKFSRILSGKSLEKQHWEDVVGYATLALEKCI